MNGLSSRYICRRHLRLAPLPISRRRRAPIYYDICLEWHERLSVDDQETCLTLIDVIASAHKGAAESIAASLPPAPRCPL